MIGRLRYANVSGTLALCLALGSGVAIAAGKIGAKDIKSDAVRAKHVKDGQVRAAETGPGVGYAAISRVPLIERL